MEEFIAWVAGVLTDRLGLLRLLFTVHVPFQKTSFQSICVQIN